MRLSSRLYGSCLWLELMVYLNFSGTRHTKFHEGQPMRACCVERHAVCCIVIQALNHKPRLSGLPSEYRERPRLAIPSRLLEPFADPKRFNALALEVMWEPIDDEVTGIITFSAVLNAAPGSDAEHGQCVG